MKKIDKKLYIGIPCYRDCDAEFLESMLNFMHCFMTHAGDWELTWHVMKGLPNIGKARDILVQHFLASDATHLLQLDTDMEFFPDRMTEMVLRDLDVVAGMACLKIAREDRLNAEVKQGGEHDESNGLVEVEAIGTAAMCVKRGVYETIIDGGLAAPYKTHFDSDDSEAECWSFHPVGVDEESGLWVGGDVAFCRIARNAGFRVFADTNNFMKHWGRISYPVQQRKETA